MGNELIRQTGEQSTESETEQTTEVGEAAHALVESMLFGAEPRPQPDGPRIILALDCTSSMGEFVDSRSITPETASAIANALFAKAPGLQVQLAFFRGDGGKGKSSKPREIRFSNEWYTTAPELARRIAAIEHWPGWTQHCRLLREIAAKAKDQAIQELVIVSDAFEERTPQRPQGDDLTAARVHAQRLRDLGVKVVFAYKGTIRGACPLDRAGVGAEAAFRTIADANVGSCFLLNPANLTAKFGQIAAQAALVAKGDAIGAQQLLEHMRTVPFEMNVVGEQVARCAAKGTQE
jgi:hypothetical protein